MFFGQTPILHSTGDEGRHWFTTLDFPPVQILPVAANLCRAGHALAHLVRSKIADEKKNCPCELILTTKDLKMIPGVEVQPKSRSRTVRVDLALKTLPADMQEEEEEDDEEAQFITPVPPANWKGSYDEWIVKTMRQIGMSVPDPLGPDSYDAALSSAIAKAQEKIPGLRKEFLRGLDGNNLGFKLGLTGSRGRKEYVWLSVLDWSDPKVAKCRLENQPVSVKGYKVGQEMQVKISDVLDYMIGSEAGCVDRGFTQTVAEDYGHIIPS